MDVRYRKVQPLGPRRRNDIRGIASKEQPPVAHLLDHVGAQGRDRHLQRPPARDAVPGDIPVPMVIDHMVRPDDGNLVDMIARIEPTTTSQHKMPVEELMQVY